MLSSDRVVGPVPAVTAEEKSEAKNGKARGPDDVPSEVWKMPRRQGAEIIAAFLNRNIVEDSLCVVWQTSITMPIWKGK